MATSIVVAERIAAGGDAIGRLDDGRVVFIDGAIPGETVEISLTASKKDFARAAVRRVVEPSPDRREPPCRFVAAGCGGCGWQHVALERQRALKREIVVDALRRISKLPGLEAIVELGTDLPGEGMRTTVRAGVTRQGRLGFRQAQRHEVIPIDDCMVAAPGLSPLLATHRWDGMDEVVLRVSAATGQRLVWWEGTGRAPRLDDDVLVGPEHHLVEVVAGAELQVSARSFFQSSPDAADALVTAVGELAAPWLGAAGAVVDAYSGVGLFAATLIGPDQPLTTVESSSSSCADARINLAGHRATIVEGSVDEWTPTPAKLVIADPARRGLGSAAAERLTATGAEAIVLVSCDASAGARDIGLLSTLGFVARRVVVLDPFPHTAHVEVVTLLTRPSSGGPS